MEPTVVRRHRDRVERVVRVAFWTLWLIVFPATLYGFVAEGVVGESLFVRLGLPHLEPVIGPRYHWGLEFRLLTVLLPPALVLLALASAGVGVYSRPLRVLGLLTSGVALVYQLLPRL